MTVLIDATPGYVSFNDGDFDTRYKYLRQISNASALTLMRGPTWGVTFVAGSNGSSGAYNFAYDTPARFSTARLSNSGRSIDVGNNTAGTAGTALDLSPSGGISISDPSTGRLLFDPSQPLMHVISEVTGSKSIASANPTGAAVTITTTHDLGTIDQIATDITGAIQMVYADPSTVTFAPVGKAGNDWWQVNGSYIVHWQYGETGVGRAADQVISGKPIKACAWSQMTFRVSTSADSVGVGHLVMDEVTKIFKLFAGGQWNPEGGGSVAAYIRPAYTLNYRLKAVAFSS